ncbi:MAG: ATP-binding cassette domain-containing protein [Bacillota bacterium]|jgi:D-methionine transport system ATP-binding protein|nr:ATP-binding cassette domain-containing protein [Bacillota bacterium]MDD3851649.1 ATP-binding cassette domain-containing protein [Bacillota bacterium]MDD4708401.1 ATP-binding cassette domain-containing protein [Bacillota bacterium]
MIRIRQLQKVYTDAGGRRVTALEDVNLHIKGGEIFGIIGPSGAGKSTLLRCINMLEMPTSGSITVDGTEVTRLKGRDLRAVRRQMGMIFQHFNLLSSRTTYRNVAFPMEISSMPDNEIKKRVERLLALVELEDKAGAYPSELSGGQKQRVGIARALATGSKILLCDEATSSLDPRTTRSILALLKSINEKYGITIVMVTHQIQAVKQICHSVAIIERSEVVEQGRVEEMFSRPGAEITKGFLEDISVTGFPGGSLKKPGDTYEAQSKAKEVKKNVG